MGPTWDPPVRAFLTRSGWQLGASFGIVVALGYCRRLLQMVREADLRIAPQEFREAGIRLGTFFGLIATLLLHGSLWVVAGFVAPRKPEPQASTVIFLGLGCGLVGGLVLGWVSAALGWLILGISSVKTGPDMPAAGALRMRLRWAIAIALGVSFLSAMAGHVFGGFAGSGYQTVCYDAPMMGLVYNRPDIESLNISHSDVYAMAHRPFLHPMGQAAGLGSGLIVAALWLWAMIARVPRSRGREFLLAIGAGVVAGLVSTWILHTVLAETVRLDTSRPGEADSLLVTGLFFAVPAGAAVGFAGAVLLALATPSRDRQGEAPADAEQKDEPIRDPAQSGS
jgi:hypothetical protein